MRLGDWMREGEVQADGLISALGDQVVNGATHEGERARVCADNEFC